jgi:hypothetical protein
MIRTLSAPGTFAQRYVFLVLWFCILGGINILMWWGKLFDPHGGPPSPEAKIVFLVIWLVPPLVAAWLTRSLKRVRMSDEGLLISDYRREILVPFSAIESISPHSKVEPFQPVEIRFRAPTEFGDGIQFVPRARYGFLPWPDPALSELRERVSGPEPRTRPSCSPPRYRRAP